jgi:molybdenum cofactor cytidylyltransferase
MSGTSIISLIVLAAGKSTRFGLNKLLLNLDRETLIGHVVRSALQSNASETVVVVGFEAERIKHALQGLNCKFAVNQDFAKGQSSSVLTGIEFVKNHADAVMILPGDMPLIRVEFINKVIDEYRSDKSSIVVASYEGRMGHPILFDASLFDELLEIDEETFGLKKVVSRHIGEVRKVEVGSVGALLDLDIRDDLNRIPRE